MKIEIDYWCAINLIHLLEEQNRSYMHCILNYVGEREVWEEHIQRNKAFIETLEQVKSE